MQQSINTSNTVINLPLSYNNINYIILATTVYSGEIGTVSTKHFGIGTKQASKFLAKVESTGSTLLVDFLTIGYQHN